MILSLLTILYSATPSSMIKPSLEYPGFFNDAKAGTVLIKAKVLLYALKSFITPPSTIIWPVIVFSISPWLFKV